MPNSPEDGREIEIIRAQAELGLAQKQELMLGALLTYKVIDTDHLDEARRMLTEFSGELLALIEDEDISTTLQSLLEDIEDVLIINGSLVYERGREALDQIQSEIDIVEGLDPEIIAKDIVWTKESISLFRAEALLLGKFNSDFIEEIEKATAFKIARDCIKYGVTLPPAVKDFFDDEQITELLKFEIQDQDRYQESVDEELEQVSEETEERIRQRFEQVEVEMKRGLERLLAKVTSVPELVSLVLGDIKGPEEYA